MSRFLAEACAELRPNYGYRIENDTVTWLETGDDEIAVEVTDTSLLPTDAEIQSKVDELEADYNAKQYQRDRQYPSIEDQLDMQYWDSVNGTTTWADAIQAVKDANPKPSE